MLRSRRAFVGKNRFNFPAQKLLVKLECFLASSIEMQIGIQLHNSPFGSVMLLSPERRVQCLKPRASTLEQPHVSAQIQLWYGSPLPQLASRDRADDVERL